MLMPGAAMATAGAAAVMRANRRGCQLVQAVGVPLQRVLGLDQLLVLHAVVACSN